MFKQFVFKPGRNREGAKRNDWLKLQLQNTQYFCRSGLFCGGYSLISLACWALHPSLPAIGCVFCSTGTNAPPVFMCQCSMATNATVRVVPFFLSFSRGAQYLTGNLILKTFFRVARSTFLCINPINRNNTLVQVSYQLVASHPKRSAGQNVLSRTSATPIVRGESMAKCSCYDGISHPEHLLPIPAIPTAGSTVFMKDPKLGFTFGMATAAVLLAMLQAGVIVVFARESGDGPFYKCIHNCMGMNSRSMPVSGGSKPQPPRLVARIPPRFPSPASNPPATTRPVQTELPRPGLYPDVPVGSSVIRPAVASRASQPVEASQAVRSPVGTQTAVPAVDIPIARPPAVGPHAQHAGATQTVEPGITSPAVQSAKTSPAVGSRMTSLTVEAAVASPDVSPPVTSTAVQITAPSQAI